MGSIHATFLVGIVLCAIPCVFTVGPVMSSWAQKQEELPSVRQATNGFMRYLAHVKAFQEPHSQNQKAPKQEPLVATKPDPLPEQLKWIGLTAVNAYLQAKQLDENTEKAEDLGRAPFDWNFNRL
ncbi:hypothetical protein AAVH_24882 [Aphelenchoides avenae]|nr:hypothetical protein AAVH_24882 [Aphelenchus avenae]